MATVKVFYFVAESQSNIGRIEIDPNIEVYDLLRAICDDIATQGGEVHANQSNLGLYKVSCAHCYHAEPHSHGMLVARL